MSLRLNFRERPRKHIPVYTDAPLEVLVEAVPCKRHHSKSVEWFSAKNSHHRPIAIAPHPGRGADLVEWYDTVRHHDSFLVLARFATSSIRELFQSQYGVLFQKGLSPRRTTTSHVKKGFGDLSPEFPLLEAGKGGYRVIGRQGPDVADLYMFMLDGNAFIQSIKVGEPYQGRSLGCALYDRAVELAVELNARTLQVGVPHEFPKVARWASREGYAPAGYLFRKDASRDSTRRDINPELD